ncbi:MAG TPA: class I SAM-dependent methyltransferase [Kofleriaceae bacterium]|nr:class I SAM-dependent methyltransferase [Kofleriaceae bacterium]
MTDTTIDLAAVKTKQQATWATGNYAIVGTTLQIVGESLCEALDLWPGSRVLDVAAGNGNATLAAARRWADVTSTDYVQSLLDQGQRRAEAEGFNVKFQKEDAENLSFGDGEFDFVLSTFGVMFTADQQKAASEMARVTKPGGKIGLANWTPGGFIGHMFKTIGKHVPPAAGLKSPALWGTKERLEELFAGVGTVEATPRMFNFRYKSVDHFVETFRTYYGPMNKTFAALDADKDKQAAFEKDLREVISNHNKSGSSVLNAPGEYLEVVITKKA